MIPLLLCPDSAAGVLLLSSEDERSAFAAIVFLNVTSVSVAASESITIVELSFALSVESVFDFLFICEKPSGLR